MKSKIISLPNSQLNQPSRKVGLIDENIQSIIDQMIKQAKLWEADREHEITVGLAAIQINQPFKIIITRQNTDPKVEAEFDIFINPKITKFIGKKTIELEGCLSVPNYYCNVERYSAVKVEALNELGQTIRFKADGFLARIIQHEIDHLKGVTIVDKAIAVQDKDGQTFKFCKLASGNKFQIVAESELEDKGIL